MIKSLDCLSVSLPNIIMQISIYLRDCYQYVTWGGGGVGKIEFLLVFFI